MGDYDNRTIIPTKDQFLIETSPFHYHLIDFTQTLSLSTLLYKLNLSHADEGFINWTEKNGYAQLRMYKDMKLIHTGQFPEYRVKMVKVTFK